MKLAFIFLTTLLAVSHQQYQLPRIFAYPQPAQQPAYYNDYLPDNPYNYLDNYSDGQQANRFNSPAVFKSLISLNKEEDKNVQPRFKIFGNQQQDNARFYFNTDSSSTLNFNVLNQGALNPFLKTVTFTLTSTCTSYSLVTCVPAGNVINTPCRRKRQIDSFELIGDGTNSQFPIVPSQIQQVEPTTQQLWSPIERDSRQSLDIVSSKEEQPAEERNNNFQVENLVRKGRFNNNLWNSFGTGTTITTWTIINSTTTITSIPTAAAPPLAVGGMPSVLNCLPSGVSIC